MNILWLKTELLHPVDRGGRIRTYQMLKELKRAGHRIAYLALEDGDAAPNARELAREYCDELIAIPHRVPTKFSAGFYAGLARNLASPLPYFIERNRSAAMRRAIEERAGRGEIDVLICDFLMPAVNVPATLNCATILFQHNVEAVIRRRQYEVQTNPLKKSVLKSQWEKSVNFERMACRRFDQVIAVSGDDRRQIEQDYGVSGVADVATGVDTDFFRLSGRIRREPRRLVFTGAMDWLPNEDGIRYFAEQILPLIRMQVPDVKLTVVGRNPYRGLVELSQRDSAITVTGRVDDVRPYMEQASAYIVPLRVGGGTRLKIFEAMAMERPLISTSIGAEGLPVRHGEELLLADSPETFAASVIKILTDEDYALELGRRAAQTVRAKFSWEKVTADFARLCEQVVQVRRRERAHFEEQRELSAAL